MSGREEDPNDPPEKIDWVLELQRERRAEDDAWNRKNGFPVNVWKDWTPEEQQAIADDCPTEKSSLLRAGASGSGS